MTPADGFIHTSGRPLVWRNTSKVLAADAKSSGNDGSCANTSAARSTTPRAACSKLPLKESAAKVALSEGDWRTCTKLRAGAGVDSTAQLPAGSSHCWAWATAAAGGGRAVASRVEAKVRASGIRR